MEFTKRVTLTPQAYELTTLPHQRALCLGLLPRLICLPKIGLLFNKTGGWNDVTSSRPMLGITSPLCRYRLTLFIAMHLNKQEHSATICGTSAVTGCIAEVIIMAIGNRRNEIMVLLRKKSNRTFQLSCLRIYSN